MDSQSQTVTSTSQFPPQSQWQQRINNEQKLRHNDHRDAFQRDRARILHSAAFRRLQAKTQVHSTGMNDFYRTRLTHSLEVSQIGTGIVAQLAGKHPQLAQLLPSDSLMESLCLAHDIGHPPFGHGGEIALNYLLRYHGGFEGNAQTFRIVTHLEPYTLKHGMNLSRRTLLGLMKYPALLSQVTYTNKSRKIDSARQLRAQDWLPAKGIYDVDQDAFDWVLEPLSQADKTLLTSTRKPTLNTHYRHAKTRFKSLDCSIMELADDIAYGVHDLEDAIVLGMVTRQQWQEGTASKLANCGDPWFETHIAHLSQQLFSSQHHLRKDAIGAIVNALLTSVEIKTTISEHSFNEPLLANNAYLPAEMAYALNVFKQFVSQYVIQVTEVQIFEYKGQQIIMELFEAFSSDPRRLLPEATKNKWQQAERSQQGGMRIIADYISAMTDGYAQRIHQQLFSPHSPY